MTEVLFLGELTSRVPAADLTADADHGSISSADGSSDRDGHRRQSVGPPLQRQRPQLPAPPRRRLGPSRGTGLTDRATRRPHHLHHRDPQDLHALEASHAYAVEPWIDPATVTSHRAAHILTLGISRSRRNLTLAQRTDRIAAPLRTSTSPTAGEYTGTPTGSLPDRLVDVVHTHDPDHLTASYIDGVLRRTETITGTFASWNPTYPVTLAALGDDTRHWRGTICLIATYDRALTPAQITTNTTAGCPPGDV